MATLKNEQVKKLNIKLAEPIRLLFFGKQIDLYNLLKDHGLDVYFEEEKSKEAEAEEEAEEIKEVMETEVIETKEDKKGNKNKEGKCTNFYSQVDSATFEAKRSHQPASDDGDGANRGNGPSPKLHNFRELKMASIDPYPLFIQLDRAKTEEHDDEEDNASIRLNDDQILSLRLILRNSPAPIVLYARKSMRLPVNIESYLEIVDLNPPVYREQIRKAREEFGVGLDPVLYRDYLSGNLKHNHKFDRAIVQSYDTWRTIKGKIRSARNATH